MQKAFTLSILVLSALGCFAQKNADKYFESFQYAAAAKEYEHILQQDSSNIDAADKLAVCYEKLNDPIKSEIVLSSLAARSTEPKYSKLYADALAENGQYEKAAIWYRKYITLKPDDAVKKKLTHYNNIADFYRDSSFYTITKTAFNSPQSDFGPVYYRDGIAFCSARDNSGATYAWDNSSFIDLYWTQQDAPSAKAFDKRINSSFHEGPFTLTHNFDTIFFTRNNYIDNKKSNSKDGVMKLKIFYAVWENGAWGKVQNFPLNNDEYSLGHPALSHDHRMYFVSDMPGGFGGSDIYYTKLENGKWTPAVNLGPNINTSENELFPYITQQGDLFFASSGHPGLGGLDIFKSTLKQQKFEKPVNVGYPINSSRDDFGLITTDKQGYFSSNRGNNPKDDNIYSFSIDKSAHIVIQAINKNGGILDDFSISIINTKDTTDQLIDHQAKNQVDRKVNAESSYTITIRKAGYDPHEMTLSREAINDLIISKKPLQVMLAESIASLEVDLVDETGKRLRGGSISVVNSKTSQEEKKYIIQNDAPLTIALTSGVTYELVGQHTGFTTSTMSVHSSRVDSLKKSSPLKIILKASKTLFEKNEVGQVIELDIKYDLGKATIRPDAALELNKLVDFLIKNPSVKVEVGSHTDVRGTEEENLKLSQRRAESAVRYIVKKGIGSTRLIPLGYGEDDLKIANATTEQEHQLNRRTTIKIVGN